MENEIKKGNNGSGCCSGNNIKQEQSSSCGCGCSQESASCCSGTWIIFAVILTAAAVWLFSK